MNPVPNAKGYSFGLLDEKFEEKIQRLEMPAADDSGHVNMVVIGSAMTWKLSKRCVMRSAMTRH
jgi:hypothetical protein